MDHQIRESKMANAAVRQENQPSKLRAGKTREWFEKLMKEEPKVEIKRPPQSKTRIKKRNQFVIGFAWKNIGHEMVENPPRFGGEDAIRIFDNAIVDTEMVIGLVVGGVAFPILAHMQWEWRGWGIFGAVIIGMIGGEWLGALVGTLIWVGVATHGAFERAKREIKKIKQDVIREQSRTTIIWTKTEHSSNCPRASEIIERTGEPPKVKEELRHLFDPNFQLRKRTIRGNPSEIPTKAITEDGRYFY